MKQACGGRFECLILLDNSFFEFDVKLGLVHSDMRK